MGLGPPVRLNNESIYFPECPGFPIGFRQHLPASSECHRSTVAEVGNTELHAEKNRIWFYKRMQRTKVQVEGLD
jgi:hypothetical protein